MFGSSALLAVVVVTVQSQSCSLTRHYLWTILIFRDQLSCYAAGSPQSYLNLYSIASRTCAQTRTFVVDNTADGESVDAVEMQHSRNSYD